jgi:hypothetical protein
VAAFVSSIVNIGSTLIDRLIPDKNAATAAKAQLVEMQVRGELDQVAGQLSIDRAEAASQSTFVAGWRPFIGWICGAALGVDFIVRPFFMWACNLLHRPADFPTLDMTELMPLILGMLGMTAAHTWQSVMTSKNGNGNGTPPAKP